MHSDQEKWSSAEEGTSFISAHPLEVVTPSLVLSVGVFPVPVGPRSLGDVLFGRNRRAARAHNQAVLDDYKGFKLYSILHDMDERLAAANPDYWIRSLGIALYRDGKEAEIWINLRAQDWPTELDTKMAEEIIHNAEMEIREHYGR